MTKIKLSSRLCLLAFLVLAGAKVSGEYEGSWLWVTAPLWMPYAAWGSLVFAGAGFVVAVREALDGEEDL